MGTVLRVFVIIILILSGAALFLAVQLYNKRELLINRTHLLEEHFRKFVKTIEEKDPPADAPAPTFTSKDVAPVTSTLVESPEKSEFWKSYPYKLEFTTQPAMNWDSTDKQLQIRQYYRTEKTPEGKIRRVPHPVNAGAYCVDGPGTMQEMMDALLDRATKQNATLNRTRQELQKLREELNTTIEQHNQLKQDGRADKKTIDEKNKEIERLNEEIRNLHRKIEGLEEEKRVLTAEVAELKVEIQKQKGTIEELEKSIKDLKTEIKRLTDLVRKPQGVERDPTAKDYKGVPGVKGKISAVDDKLKFVVIELSQDAMTELVGEDRKLPMPQIELMVRRPGFKSATGEFITRIKCRQVLRQNNLVVADILIDWQQSPVQVNDEVFY
jgi:uncharacterized protein YoxC